MKQNVDVVKIRDFEAHEHVSSKVEIKASPKIATVLMEVKMMYRKNKTDKGREFAPNCSGMIPKMTSLTSKTLLKCSNFKTAESIMTNHESIM